MKVLFVDCCISLRDKPRTELMADTFLEKLRSIHPDWELETVKLQKKKLFALEEEDLLKREHLLQNRKFEDPFFDLSHQFALADRILIAAPCWEMTFPSKLRVYIEHISVSGVTFRYTPQGSVGQCKAKKLLFLTSAGGPAVGAEEGRSYMEAMTRFWGIREFEYVIAEMQDVQEVNREEFLHLALRKLELLAETF